MCQGRYEIRRTVADGGMGRVYQALDVEENRSVAIKVLHPEVAQDDVALERFKREYELSQRLPHEHIVEVFDFVETEDGSFALVMEYLEGEELRSFMQREGLVRPERMLRLLSQLAIGLREPHQLALVHRDIKPDNIFLCGTEEGPVVKLLDFGSVRDNSAGAKKLTVIGTTIGSPYYMSPEQAQGLQDLDQRADVWSIAAIAYEALTGKVPFNGATGPQILLAIMGKEPTPPSLVTNADGFVGPRVPEALDDVVADALCKNAAIRIPSVAELADRFGQGFGLEGDHHQWAAMPESELGGWLEEVAVRGARTPTSGTMQGEHASSRSPYEDGAPQVHGAIDRSQPGHIDSHGFDNDEDFVMGLPDDSGSTRIFVIIGIVVVLLIGGAVAMFLS